MEWSDLRHFLAIARARSLNGAAILMQHGHERVASLAGGIDRWSIEIDPSLPRY